MTEFGTLPRTRRFIPLLPITSKSALQSSASLTSLGHASTAFTMDVYAASVPALEEETAAKVAALLE